MTTPNRHATSSNEPANDPTHEHWEAALDWTIEEIDVAVGCGRLDAANANLIVDALHLVETAAWYAHACGIRRPAEAPDDPQGAIQRISDAWGMP